MKKHQSKKQVSYTMSKASLAGKDLFICTQRKLRSQPFGLKHDDELNCASVRSLVEGCRIESDIFEEMKKDATTTTTMLR